MPVSGLDQLLDGGRGNAAAAWLLVVLLAATAVGIVIVTGPLWSVFALILVVLALIPPLAYRSPAVMLPWEVLLMAALPVVGLAVGGVAVGAPPDVPGADAAPATDDRAALGTTDPAPATDGSTSSATDPATATIVGVVGPDRLTYRTAAGERRTVRLAGVDAPGIDGGAGRWSTRGRVSWASR